MEIYQKLLSNYNEKLKIKVFMSIKNFLEKIQIKKEKEKKIREFQNQCLEKSNLV